MDCFQHRGLTPLLIIVNSRVDKKYMLKRSHFSASLSTKLTLRNCIFQ